QCLKQLNATGEIKEFLLGASDISERFQIPQKLYGRDEEISLLLSAFERVNNGSRELMLVSGYSGIGKSSLVQEVYKPITKKRGYFIRGKYDQLQRNIPYLGIIKAFNGLIRQILMEDSEHQAAWREKLLAVLGPNAQ